MLAHDPVSTIRGALSRSSADMDGLTRFLNGTDWLHAQLKQLHSLARPNGSQPVNPGEERKRIEETHARQLLFFINNKAAIPDDVQKRFARFSTEPPSQAIRTIAAWQVEMDGEVRWFEILTPDELLNLSNLFFLQAKGIECRVRSESDVVAAARESEICFKAALQAYQRWLICDHPEWN